MAQRPDELNDNETTAAALSTTEADAMSVGSSAAAVAAADSSATNVSLQNRAGDEDDYAALTDSDNASGNDDTNAEGTPSDEVTDETEQLRGQIEETRSNLGDTINAIQEKLSVSNITEQVKDEVSEQISTALKSVKETVYDAAVSKVGNIMSYVNKGMDEFGKTEVGRAAYQQPLALSLIGLGVGMILVNGFSKNRTKKTYRYNYEGNSGGSERRGIASSSGGGQSTFERARSPVSDYAGQAYEGAGNAAGAVGDYAGKAKDAIGDYAGKAKETVGEYAGKFSETVTGYAGAAREQVGNLGGKAKDYAGAAQDQYEYYMDENPLAVGAVAIALGAAVGMAFPSTTYENRLMGETRDELMEKAQGAAREALSKVQSAAGNVTETVKQVAGEVTQSVKEGAGDITQKVKDGAGTVANSVKDEAANQGLTDAK